MIDLSTEYLGLKLNNPIVPSASPQTEDLDTSLRLQEAGASAIIMHSLFEEKIQSEQEHQARFFHQQSIGHGEADSFHPVPGIHAGYQDTYLEQLERLKSELDIPVIASLNGSSSGGWTEYARLLEEAGADALELNAYYIAADPDESSQQIEDRYIDLLSAVVQQVSIPVTMKLSSQFSALIHVVQRMEAAGAKGVALFNRFYQPDIDLETLHVTPKLELSTSMEALIRIRWIAILHGHVKCSLAVTGGIHTSEDALKALFAGADIVHLCSALLQHGPSHIQKILSEMKQWLLEHEYESVHQLKGSISRRHAIDPAAYERTNYINVLDSYSHPSGVLR